MTASRFIRTYGEPGGLWTAYGLDFGRDEYVVVNEGGDELFTSPNEQECIDFCEELTAR
jgi:hypothetical protein